jgi:TRAP-type C4-dicarboxylate transport system permease small subunit
MVEKLKKGFQWALETWVIVLMFSTTVIVVMAVVFRKAGYSLGWADEISRVLLAWLTYYGSALAALRRAHIGFPGLLNRFSPKKRLPFLILGEAFVIAFFGVMVWVGLEVYKLLEGDTLVSLTWVPLRLTQSVIPVGSFLFIVAELLSLAEEMRPRRISEIYRKEGGHKGEARG